MLIIDRGRKKNEKSVILIENGHFKGIAFYNSDTQINDINSLKSILTPMSDNRDAQNIIQSFTRNKKGLKIIPLNELITKH